MHPTIQSGTHPDAETLTAFVEQSLSADLREHVLAHLSACARCREVAFLAQHAAEAESATPAAPARTPAQKSGGWWLGGWRWAWVSVGAFGVLVAIATVLHVRHAKTETQMAQNGAESKSLRPASETPVVAEERPASPGQGRRAERTVPQGARRNASVQHENGALEAVKEKGVAKKSKMAVGADAPPIAVQPGLAGGSMHGAMIVRSQGRLPGGLMANQPQPSEMQQNLIRQNPLPQQNLFQSRQNPNEPLRDQRVISGLAPASASETVTVEAQAAKAKPAPAAPRPPDRLSYGAVAAVSDRNLEVSSGATMQLKLAAKVALPNGAQALSVASGAGRTVAVDTSGALFLSEDQGKHWTPVATQWTGRAVLVHNLQAGTKDAALQVLPIARFELVNDKLQSWTSADGKTWTAETPSVK
jgi:hypothetical protein